jgi:hypothetical protein
MKNMETIKVKYIGQYNPGCNPDTGLCFTPQEIREVTLRQAEILVESNQFEVVQNEFVHKEVAPRIHKEPVPTNEYKAPNVIPGGE